MRFRFLGEGDCPDWLLAEINALSRMTSIKMKLLGQLVAKSITDGELDCAFTRSTALPALKTSSLFLLRYATLPCNPWKTWADTGGHILLSFGFVTIGMTEARVKKLTQDAKLELGDAKAIVAALELILTSSARYGVTPADLSNELQQLGLPREHSAALARIHTEVSSRIVNEALVPQSLRQSRLSSVEVHASDEDNYPFSRVSIKFKKLASSDETEEIVHIPKVDVLVLLAELKKVRAMMEGI